MSTHSSQQKRGKRAERGLHRGSFSNFTYLRNNGFGLFDSRPNFRLLPRALRAMGQAAAPRMSAGERDKGREAAAGSTH